MQPVRYQEKASHRVSMLKAAYDAGYGDAVVLLRPRSPDCASLEPIERVQARYLDYLAQGRQTAEAVAYLSGYADAAADNLPCPSHAIGRGDHRLAA